MLSFARRVVVTLSVASVVVSIGAVATQASAQTPASAYVPLDDNAYVYANALIARGRLRALSQLERPYRVSEFKLAMARDSGGSEAIQSLYRRLNEALVRYDVSDIAPDSAVMRFVVTPYLVATAQTSGQRELMLADSVSRLRPGFGGVGIVQFGSMVAGTRAYDDPRLKDDPEFLGQKNRRYVGRMEDAYVSAQFRYGELFLGRLGRNWGPPQLDGLLLGHSAYTYDHAYVKIGLPALHLSTIVTRLDDATRSNNGGGTDSANRFFSVHQLAARFGAFEAAVSEAVVYGGASENFRLNYVNPLTPYILSEVLEKSPGNIVMGADLSYRSNVGNFGAQVMVDDITKDHCAGACAKPNSFGFTLTAEGVPFLDEHRLFASYTLVSSLAYRNEEWYDVYTSQQVGLGRAFADYDEIRVGADVLLPTGVPVRPYLAYRRQGEGDYRLPHPTVDEYPQTKQFLEGVAQRTTRIGISGASSIARFLHVSGDIGFNYVTNARHVSGTNVSNFEGRVMMTLESPWAFAGALRPDVP